MAFAKEFTRFVGPKAELSKINIVELDGMWVNEFCYKHKKDCLMFFINKEKAPKKELKKDPLQAGNPASLYCNSIGGVSEIYTDAENNQHDYCNFNDKYIIDSWNLIKRFKR